MFWDAGFKSHGGVKSKAFSVARTPCKTGKWGLRGKGTLFPLKSDLATETPPECGFNGSYNSQSHELFLKYS